MKVWIGKPRNWFGPYQLAEKLMFWVPKEKDEYGFEHTAEKVHHFGEWLAHGAVEPEPKVGEITKMWEDRHMTWLYKFLLWIDKCKQKIPNEHIKIDRWDTWSMDYTLAPIILPMLKQLKETKHGSPNVDMEDVPEFMRTTNTEKYENQMCFDFYHDKEDEQKCKCDVHTRWDWVMNEMIFAFEHHANKEWEEAYRSGEHDLQWKKMEDGSSQMVHGPNDTYECDYDGIAKVEARIQNGFRLFGKYFTGLWD